MSPHKLRQNTAQYAVTIGTKQVHDTGELDPYLCDLCPAYDRSYWPLRTVIVWVCDECLPFVNTWIDLRQAATVLPSGIHHA